MSGVATSVDLRHGACADLLPEVADKYLLASSGITLFVGRAICAHCPVRQACLEEAIVEPPGAGMRGGEPNHRLWELHAAWMDDHQDEGDLATEAVTQQYRKRHATKAVREGQFMSPALAFPELGGVA